MKTIKLLGIGIAILACGVLFASAANSSDSQDRTAQTEYKINTKKKCPTCDGSGKMTIKKTCSSCGYTSNPGCERCDYKGYTETKVRCSTCEGSGYITQTIER